MDLLSDSREIIRNEVVQNKCTPLCNKLYSTFLSVSNIILFLFPLVVVGEGGGGRGGNGLFLAAQCIYNSI